MTESPRRRPGRKLAEDPTELSYGSSEVNVLIARVHQIVNQSGVTLTAAAESGGWTKQTLTRLLHSAQPAQHIVESVVRYCIGQTGGQDQHRWLDEVNRLWTQAQAAQPHGPAAIGPPAPAPALGLVVDPKFLDPLLDLLIEGEHELIAVQMVTAYPDGGAGAGGVLGEIGRRSPGGAAAVIGAVAEQAGQGLADACMEALTENTVEVADVVRRLLPPRLPEVPEPVAPAVVSVADLEPLVFDGRRLARLILRGNPARAASEILTQATPESVPESNHDGSRRLRLDLNRIFAERELGHERVNIGQATRLLLSLRQGDDDDPRTFALVLGQLVLRGHTELAAVVLHQLSQDQAVLATAVLELMNRPDLLSVLEAATTPTDRMRPGITEALLAQVPASGAADFLLAAAHSSDSAKGAADMLVRLPHCTAVLHCMAANDHQHTARVLNALAADWILARDAPEGRIAEAFLSLARTDTSAAARVLLQFLRLNTRSAADLLFLMEIASAEGDATQVAAKTIAGTLDLAPEMASVLIARMACRDDFPIRLLERVAVENPAHGTLIATRMLAQDLTYFRAQIPPMIRQQATTIAGELLRQLEDLEPAAPWNLIRHALSDGAVPSALANADAYLAGL